jgi:plasmid maintenance system antidote protein VapI
MKIAQKLRIDLHSPLVPTGVQHTVNTPETGVTEEAVHEASNSFGLLLRKELERHGISVRGLARAIEKSPSYVSAVLNGLTAPPTVQTLLDIAENVPGLKFETLLEWSSRWSDAIAERCSDACYLLGRTRIGTLC